MFPRKIEHLTMHTFRPPEVTPEFNQSGASVGVQDRFAISPTMVLESTLAGRWFEINVNTDGRQAMIYAPETQQGSFFNDQEREVQSVQWVEALSVSRRQVAWTASLQVRTRFSGLEVHRLERQPAGGAPSSRRLTRRADRAGWRPSRQEVTAAELGVFAQDRWRLGSRVTLELGAPDG